MPSTDLFKKRFWILAILPFIIPLTKFSRALRSCRHSLATYLKWSKISCYGFDELLSQRVEISKKITTELEEKVKALEIEAQANNKVTELENKNIDDLVKKVGREGAIQLITASKAVQGLDNLAKNPSHKLVLLPNDFKGMIKLIDSESLKV